MVQISLGRAPVRSLETNHIGNDIGEQLDGGINDRVFDDRDCLSFASSAATLLESTNLLERRVRVRFNQLILSCPLEATDDASNLRIEMLSLTNLFLRASSLEGLSRALVQTSRLEVCRDADAGS